MEEMSADFYAADDLYWEGHLPLKLTPSDGLTVRVALAEAAARSGQLPVLSSLSDGHVYGLAQGGEVTEKGLRVWGRIDVFPEQFRRHPGSALARAVAAVREGRWRGLDVLAHPGRNGLDLVAVKIGPGGPGRFTVVPPETRQALDLVETRLAVAGMKLARRELGTAADFTCGRPGHLPATGGLVAP
jgi:hypothetical protein